MKPAFLPVAILALSAAACSAGAAPNPKVEARYSAAYNRCLGTPDGQTDPGMRDCMSAEIIVQDRALNRAYQTLLPKLEPEQRKLVVAAQRAWIAYRDADCGSYYYAGSGSMDRAVAMSCTLDRTIERTIDLEDFLPE